jgi:pimeloyl-ACP methyl ester carboxylesterase
MKITFSQQAEKNLCQIIGAKINVHKITIDPYEINYATAGQGEPLLLIHGLNIGWGNWYANITELAKHFTVYALDLPGCGQSTKIDFYQSDLEKDFVDVVDKFIDRLQLKNIHIIGHSFGGWIALKLLLKNKATIQKIVLVDPVGFSPSISGKQKLIAIHSVANLLAKTAMKPTRKNMKTFLKSAMVDQSNLKEEFVDYFHQAVIKDKITHPFQMMSHLLKPFRFREDLSLINDLPRMHRPILLVTGEKDPIIDFKKNHSHYKKIPQAEIAIFRNTGHVPPIEKSSKFNQIVLNFLLKNRQK